MISFITFLPQAPSIFRLTEKKHCRIYIFFFAGRIINHSPKCLKLPFFCSHKAYNTSAKNEHTSKDSTSFQQTLASVKIMKNISIISQPQTFQRSRFTVLLAAFSLLAENIFSLSCIFSPTHLILHCEDTLHGINEFPFSFAFLSELP